LNISGKQTMAQTCTALSLNFIIPGPEEGLWLASATPDKQKRDKPKAKHQKGHKRQ
jgi:hypothetical protein